MPVVSDYILDHPASEILRRYLLNQGLIDLPNSGGDWPCLLVNLVDGVDENNIIVIYDETPSLDGYALEDGEFLCHYPVTALLRSTDYEIGYLKMFSIMSDLSSVVREIVSMDSSNNYLLQSVSNTSGVVYVGVEKDTKRRRVFEMNLLISVTKF